MKSLKWWKEKLLKPWKDKYWHARVTLCKNNICTRFIVSRLVAITFIPNPDNLPFVCHKDETIIDGLLDNSVKNLWWGTSKDNSIDCHRKWRWNDYFKLNNPKFSKWKFWKDHNRSKSISQYTKDWEFIKQWGSIMEAQRKLWINNSNISQCCQWKWKYKTAWWFIWKYTLTSE